MNVQSSLIHEPIPYKFKPNCNSTDATKNIYCTKGKGAVDHSTVNKSK